MIAITDDTGAVAAKFAYTPFGELLERVVINPACDIPVGFAGEYGVLREPDGLYYMNARYYDPEMGRFLSEDPAGLGGGDLTLYSYAGNNPVVFVDPSGLCGQSSGFTGERSGVFWDNGRIVGERGLESPGLLDPVLFGAGQLGVKLANTGIGAGTAVYRVYGGGAGANGASWTTVNPLTVNN